MTKRSIKTDIVYPADSGGFFHSPGSGQTMDSVLEIFHAAGGRNEQVHRDGGEYRIGTRQQGYFVPGGYTLTRKQKSALQEAGCMILTVPGRTIG